MNRTQTSIQTDQESQYTDFINTTNATTLQAPPKKSQPKIDLGKGLQCMVGGVLLQLFLGSFFLWGNISIYVISYFNTIGIQLSYDFIFVVDVILVFSLWFGYQMGTYLL